MRDYSKHTTEKLLQMKQDIWKRNYHWNTSKDGSHELALHCCGYYDIVDELKNRGELKNDN